ncbi:hypothetical protein HYW46_02575 [Candidatus Daviesbacteria bacterium]|nr:hypothetical protein [Candidatus Daviesbacteria bacterium]
MPLVEIVTEPDFTDSSQIRDYAKKLQDIFRETGVSNADMERGDMRLEANVSVRLIGQQELPSYRIELKNINSFRFMVAAVEYEIKRQSEALERREKLFQETRGWNEAKKQTYLQRSKEEAHDYRYFPDPDLPKLRIRSDLVEKLREQVEQKHPKNKIKRWELLGVPYNSGATIIRQGMSNFFEEAVKIGESEGVAAQKIANYIINQKVDLVDSSPKQVVDDVAGKSMGVIGDTGELEKLANEAISENPKIVEDYKKGKESAVQALIGVVMKKTSGKAEPSVTKKCLEKMLKI